MRGLTIHNPFATAIAEGLKRYETRSWPTKYRGQVLIHASAKRTGKLYPQAWGELNRRRADCITFGASIVAVADIVACQEMTLELINAQSFTEILLGEWLPCRFAWKLENVRALPDPVFCKGQQGLWKPKADVLAEVARYLS